MRRIRVQEISDHEICHLVCVGRLAYPDYKSRATRPYFSLCNFILQQCERLGSDLDLLNNGDAVGQRGLTRSFDDDDEDEDERASMPFAVSRSLQYSSLYLLVNLMYSRQVDFPTIEVADPPASAGNRKPRAL